MKAVSGRDVLVLFYRYDSMFWTPGKYLRIQLMYAGLDKRRFLKNENLIFSFINKRRFFSNKDF